MLDSYTSSMCLWPWGRMDYAHALIDIKVDREVNEDMVIVIPNVEDDGEVLHTVRWSMNGNLLDVRCVWYLGMMICYVQNGLLKCLRNNIQTMMLLMIRMQNVTSSANPFNACNTIEEGDELGSYMGSSNLGKEVVQDVASSAFGSQGNTPLVARINYLESQMIEGKLVLLDDEGKTLQPFKSTLSSSSNVVSKKVDDLVNEDIDSDVEEVYDKTATYMASTSFNVNKAFKNGRGWGKKSLYEQWKENHDEDPYNDDAVDDYSLTDAQMKLIHAFHINLMVKLDSIMSYICSISFLC
uniref:Reverse transcriptase domain-containing protein n=1 Tax=Tanacetum cinerariifolium TaxID=118510 RepID=A0A6L2KDM9_TANCI|nr:reverse transcriptase domain-containing protein [Tanacetum cinerariifolium]